MKNLTDRQKQILLAVIRFIDREGKPPTVREVADEFKLNWITVRNYLLAIEKKDFIKLKYYSHRGIKINHDRIGYTVCDNGDRRYYVREEIK